MKIPGTYGYKEILLFSCCIIVGKHFYYRGCGWRKKTVPWTDNDKEWIKSINNLLDMMLGPDHLDFEQTPDTKYCHVSSHSVPEYQYDHQKWEDQFTSAESGNSPPVTTFKTPEPPRKLPKLSSKPHSVKRELNLKPEDQSMIKKFIYQPSRDVIRVPRVPARGGTFGNITLVNTCPIDNFLAIVYCRLKEVPEVSKRLSRLSESWANDLVTIERLFDNNEFTQGKIKWLSYFPQFNFTVSRGTFDVWGNELDLFWTRCDSLLKTSAKSTCSSGHCPKKEEIITATGIHLMEVASQQIAETYIEAALREWLQPAPSQCGRQFSSKPPPATADVVLGPQTLDLTSGQFYQPYVCNGVRTCTERTFCNGMPFALPIPLHHFSSNGLITEPHHLPDTLGVQNRQYQLGGCTFWNGTHYSGCFKFKSQWFSYDGLPESRCRGSGILAVPLKSSRPRGFALSTCVYFEVNSGMYISFINLIFIGLLCLPLSSFQTFLK